MWLFQKQKNLRNLKKYLNRVKKIQIIRVKADSIWVDVSPKYISVRWMRSQRGCNKRAWRRKQSERLYIYFETCIKKSLKRSSI